MYPVRYIDPGLTTHLLLNRTQPCGGSEYTAPTTTIERRVVKISQELFVIESIDAASAFYVSGYEESAVMVVDGIGEFESTTFYMGKGTRLKRYAILNIPTRWVFCGKRYPPFWGSVPMMRPG